MKFTSSAAIAVLSAIGANAVLSDSQVSAVNALFQDIGANENEYLGFMQTAQNFNFPMDLVGIFTVMMAATDDSYTTFFHNLPDSEYAEITQLAQTMPWYSSRLQTIFEGAAAATSSAAASSSAAPSTTEAASSAAPSSEAPSSEAASSPAATSAAASSAPASTSVAVQTAAASSAVATFEGAANVAGVAGLSVGASLFAYLLL